MGFIEEWDEFTALSQGLAKGAPSQTRLLLKYRHADGKCSMKTTDNSKARAPAWRQYSRYLIICLSGYPSLFFLGRDCTVRFHLLLLSLLQTITHGTELAADMRFIDRLLLSVAEEMVAAPPRTVSSTAESAPRGAAAAAAKTAVAHPAMSGAQQRKAARELRAAGGPPGTATGIAAPAKGAARKHHREAVKAAKGQRKRARREERRLKASLDATAATSTSSAGNKQ